MSHANEIIDALKTALRLRGITYAQLAPQLGLSESSIKRLFASGNFSLKRLQTICDLIGIEFFDLAEIAETRRRHVEQLSEEQEKTLVADTKLLLVAFLLLNHWSYKQITAAYDISETEGTRLLAKLDRLRIIELLPENKVRMLLSRTFRWRDNGPIQRFFEDQVQSEFFKSRFNGEDEIRLVLTGSLSNHAIKTIRQRLQRLTSEFEALVKEDKKMDLTDRRGTTLIAAFRPWELTLFEQYRKTEHE